MKEFNNKVVVITGAGSGMGRAYAVAFAKRGARLVLNDWDARSLQDTVRLLPRQGNDQVYTEAFDVGDRKLMFDFAARAQQRFGAADVVINNAGIAGAFGRAWEISEEDYARIMRVNFYGVLNGTQAFLPKMLESGRGAIVNVSSIFGLVGSPLHGDYCAAKFAVRGFTEALMIELHDKPVTVHLVHPGGIATNIANGAQDHSFAQRYLITPPEDIAERVIRGIQRGEPRIVYGNDAQRTWLGARFVPLRILKAIMWRELRHTLPADTR